MSKRASHRDRISQTLQRTSTSSVTSDFTYGSGDLQNIAVSLVTPRSRQPRRQFDDQSMQNLVESVRAQGVMQPIVVHQRSDGGIELVAGERRLRAAQQVGLTTIPAKVVSELEERQLDFIAAMENLQREDLNPVDEADAILNILSDELSVPRDELPALLSHLRRASRAGHNVMSKGEGVTASDEAAIRSVETVFSQLARGNWQSFVANKMGVLKLPDDLLEAVRRGDIEYTKAMALRKVKDPEIRDRVMSEARGASLEQLRGMIRDATDQPDDDARAYALRLGKVAKAEKWKALSTKERVQATKLLEKLESLFESG
jgi:ParB family chromosome partitioning protein